MCRLRACFAIAGVALLLTSPLKTQTAQTTVTTFTSSTELVLVPTVVNDKSGAHISGLKKEEFALKQDGLANLSNLAAWRADGTISSDDELKSEWLRLANSQ